MHLFYIYSSFVQKIMQAEGWRRPGRDKEQPRTPPELTHRPWLAMIGCFHVQTVSVYPKVAADQRMLREYAVLSCSGRKLIEVCFD